MWVILCLGLDNNVVYIKLTNPTGKRLKETPQIYAEERNKKDPFRLNPNFASLQIRPSTLSSHHLLKKMPSRPEYEAPPEFFYNDQEARKYTTSSRIMEIQVRIHKLVLFFLLQLCSKIWFFVVSVCLFVCFCYCV